MLSSLASVWGGGWALSSTKARFRKSLTGLGGLGGASAAGARAFGCAVAREVAGRFVIVNRVHGDEGRGQEVLRARGAFTNFRAVEGVYSRL